MIKDTKNINYLFHGGFEAEIKDKCIDVLVAGNYSKEPLFSDYNKSPMKIELYIVNKIKELIPEIYYLDQWYRYEYRRKVLECLISNDIEFTLIGEGYPDYIVNNKNVDWLGGQNIDKTIETIGNSKILIDTTCSYSYGFHERIFTSMLCKCVCFTPYTPYREGEMGAKLKYIYMNNLNGMKDEIGSILSNWGSLSDELNSIYEYAKKYHTWEKRGEQIINFLNRGKE